MGLNYTADSYAKYGHGVVEIQVENMMYTLLKYMRDRLMELDNQNTVAQVDYKCTLCQLYMFKICSAGDGYSAIHGMQC